LHFFSVRVSFISVFYPNSALYKKVVSVKLESNWSFWFFWCTIYY